MLGLWEVLIEFADALCRGDKSWLPFMLAVAGITTVVIIMFLWVT